MTLSELGYGILGVFAIVIICFVSFLLFTTVSGSQHTYVGTYEGTNTQEQSSVLGIKGQVFTIELSNQNITCPEGFDAGSAFILGSLKPGELVSLDGNCDNIQVLKNSTG